MSQHTLYALGIICMTAGINGVIENSASATVLPLPVVIHTSIFICSQRRALTEGGAVTACWYLVANVVELP